MTLRLTYQQLTSLKLLFDVLVMPEKPADVAESLVKDLMTQVYKKLRDKLEGRQKDGYSITLTDIQAKAYYVYFQNRSLPAECIYEQTMIDRHVNEIDKAYA